MPLESLPSIAATCRALEEELGPQCRVMVRYSGTEPKLRLLVEGPSKVRVQVALARLEAAARYDLVARLLRRVVHHLRREARAEHPHRAGVLEAGEIEQAEEAGVPVTNYGLAISCVQGVLKRVLSPFPAALDAFMKETDKIKQQK